VGVPVGVVFVLSTRDLREPDLGVILLLRKDEMGVVTSSRWLASGRGPRRDNGVVALCGVDPATLGVRGVLLVFFAAAAAAERVGMSGLVVPWCFSYGGIFALPLFPTGGLLGGTRIMALLSFCCRTRRVELEIRGRLEIASLSGWWLLFSLVLARLVCFDRAAPATTPPRRTVAFFMTRISDQVSTAAAPASE
jgi:hypothetical protein